MPKYTNLRHRTPELPDTLKYIALAVVFVIGGLVASCASVTPASDYKSLPPLKGVSVPTFEHTSLLEVTPEMQRFIDRHISMDANPMARLRRLVYVIHHPGLLGYEYNPHDTYSAAESFSKRGGNCVAYTNMLVALARAAGLRAKYQEQQIPPSWSERKDILLLNLHLNVSVKIAGTRYTIDVAEDRVMEVDDVRRLSDAAGAAHYYNNLGVEALLENELGPAFAYFQKGLEEDATQSFLWTNIGVIYNRTNQLSEAEWAYGQALQVNAADYTAMNNLAEIYREQGRRAEAQKLLARAESHRLKNPYYLMLLSEDALAKGQLEDANQLINRAIKRKPGEYRFQFAKARIAYRLGQFELAEEKYLLAQQLAPAKIRKRDYNLSLSEIMRRTVVPNS